MGNGKSSFSRVSSPRTAACLFRSRPVREALGFVSLITCLPGCDEPLGCGTEQFSFESPPEEEEALRAAVRGGLCLLCGSVGRRADLKPWFSTAKTVGTFVG